MNAEDLRKNVVSAYFWLRVGMGSIALAFPLLLWIVGEILSRLILQDSMSAYYHANKVTHDLFVGILFALGIMLFLYPGFTKVEDYVLNAAGILAIGIALFPMAWPQTHFQSVMLLPNVSAHGFCAITFFLCIAYICLFHAKDTLSLSEHTGKRARALYETTYKVLGLLMIFSVPIASIAAALFGRSRLTFFIEAVGVWVFAIFWLVKTREQHWTQADEKAARGDLEVVKHTNAPPSDMDTNLFKSVPPILSGEQAKPSLMDQILGRVTVKEAEPTE